MSERYRDERRRAELELSDDGTFTYDGIDVRYEDTRVSGTWVERGRWLHVDGMGRVHDFCSHRQHRGEFHARFWRAEDGSLAAERVDAGWSLLSTTEPLRPVPPGEPRLREELAAFRDALNEPLDLKAFADHSAGKADAPSTGPESDDGAGT